MLLHKPKIEQGRFLVPSKQSNEQVVGYESLMTRQSLRALFQNIPYNTIILPRFVPAGVYQPLVESGKKILYYDVPNNLRISEEQILSLGAKPTEAAFYYIHQFGLYIPENIALLRKLQQQGYFVIDDRSLTLPTSGYEEFADATAYSFYKLVGIPCGAQVRLQAPSAFCYDKADRLQRRLQKKMLYNFYFYANPFVSVLPALHFRIYNRLFSRYVGYNHLATSPQNNKIVQMPPTLAKKLYSVDFEKVTKRRKEIAAIYLDELPRSLQLPLAPEAYLHQSFMGFPLLLSQPGAVVKQLIRKGIYTFRFTQIWWWDSTCPPCDLYNRNILLPAHHHLSNNDVRYIIQSVRECCE